MLRIRSVALSTNLWLAPIAGYCDLAFRLVVRRLTGPHGGVGLASTDLISSHAVKHAADKVQGFAATCPEDQPLCVQLYGADAGVLADAAQWAEAHDAAVIDINMGCPVDKVTKKHGGSRLLCDPAGTVELARRVVRAVRVPVTAKLRLGWDDAHIVAPSLAPALAGVGIAAVTIHGRTTEQLFTGQVRLEGIADVVRALRGFPDVPVIGNGDVKSPQDARRMIDVTGCHGVMIGRGALGQPWIFRDTAHYLATGELPRPLPRADRARVVLDHFDTLVRLRGPKAALSILRQRIAWYSPFLQPWPRLRHDVRAMQSPEEFRAYLSRGVERLERSPVAP